MSCDDRSMIMIDRLTKKPNIFSKMSTFLDCFKVMTRRFRFSKSRSKLRRKSIRTNGFSFLKGACLLRIAAKIELQTSTRSGRFDGN